MQSLSMNPNTAPGRSRRTPRPGVAGPLVTAVFPLIVAAIAVGVWQTLAMALGLGRDGVTIELEITIPLVVLLLVIPFLDRAGVYRSPLAISVGIVIVPTLALFLLSRLSSLPSLLHVAPASWLIGLQVFRVAVVLPGWSRSSVVS